MVSEGSQVDLFIAILIRFPQIGTIQYDPERTTLCLTFLLREAKQDFPNFAHRFESHLALFHKLRQDKDPVVSLKMFETGELAFIEVVRDLASLSLSELNLIVQLVNDYYGVAVVQEGDDMEEDEALEQNLMIDALLTSSAPRTLERLTGFREDGRVLVFSVPLGVSES